VVEDVIIAFYVITRPTYCWFCGWYVSLEITWTWERQIG